MLARTVPVAVHMWFRAGDGWAGHPILWNQLSQVVKAVDKYLKFSKTRVEFVLPYNRGTLVGETAPDHDCKDEKAVKRSPFILRVAYLEDVEPNDPRLELARQSLRHLRLPTEQGQFDWLEISLSSELVRLQPDPREPATHKTQEVLSASQASHERDLRDSLSSERRRNFDLTEDCGRLERKVRALEMKSDSAKSLVRTAKKTMLAMLFVGVFHLLCWPFGNRNLVDLVLGLAVPTFACLGLYLTRKIKIFRRIV